MVLYSFYKKDTDTSFEKAVALFEEMFVKMTRSNTSPVLAGRDWATEPLSEPDSWRC